MSLNEVSKDVYVLEGASNISILLYRDEALVIDTGLGDSGARKIRRWADENGIEIRWIINTHSHADHFGGNSYLLKKFPDIRILAPEIEDAFIKYPILEPTFLYGASPPEVLRSDFLMSQASPVHETLSPGKKEIGPFDIEIVPLPGHSFNQIGVIFDDIFFVADSLFVPTLMEKYGVLYFTDFNEWLRTFEKLMEFTDFRFILGHRKWESDQKELVKKNIEHLEQVRKTISSCLKDKNPLSCMFNRLGIQRNPISMSLALVSIKAVFKNLGVDYFEILRE